MASSERRGGAAHAKLRAGEGRAPHVVIVGAGFGGLAAARRLARAPVDVTVIDRRNHHLFQPLLYQVATAALSPADIASPVRSILRGDARTEVLLDEIRGVDLERHEVLAAERGPIRYDYLVLATGSRYAYFGHEDWPRHAPGLKSVEDATAIRRTLLLAFERAESAVDEQRRRSCLTFVLIGAGPTGVEMAGAVAELARATLVRDFRHIDPRSARIVLVEAGPRVLPGFPPSLAAYTETTLRRMGVEVRLNTPVTGIVGGEVSLGEERIAAGLIVWCAGVRATPVGEWLGVETARNGTVAVAPDLSVPGAPEVFVIGDAASAKGPDGTPLPGLAAVAKQQGDYVGEVIRRRVAGEGETTAFRYRNRGMLATIGRRAAVADLYGLRLKGFLAWLVWGAAHIYFLIGVRNRVAVFASWLWSWLTWGRGARLITGEDRSESG